MSNLRRRASGRSLCGVVSLQTLIVTRWSLPLPALLVLGLPVASPAQVSPVIAYYDSVEAAQPKFEDFPAQPWRGTPARLDLRTPKWARTYRTVLREGAE